MRCLSCGYFLVTFVVNLSLAASASHGTLYTGTLSLWGAVGVSLGPFESSCNLHYAVASLQYPLRFAVTQDAKLAAEQLTDSPAARQTEGVLATQASTPYSLLLTGTAKIEQNEEFQVAMKVTGDFLVIKNHMS